MKTSLLKGLDEKGVKEIKGLFIESHRLRQIILERLNEKVADVQKERLSKTEFDSQWAYKQAEMNGYERSINELKSLLED